MKIFINKNETTEKYIGNILGEILDQIQKHHAIQGTTITAIFIDGKSVEFDAEREDGRLIRSRKILEIRTLEVEISSVQEIIIKNLQNVEDYLDRLIPGIQKAAELFQIDDEIKANKFFLNIVNGMEWLSEVLDGTVKALKLDQSHIKFRGKTLSERQTHLVELTKQLLEANQNKDWILVADLLEYEIAPFYMEWADFLPDLKNRAKEKIN